MATLQQRISLAFTRVGTETKAIRGVIGLLANLTTTAKGSVVDAINELKAGQSSAGAQINDVAPSSTAVYSSTKTDAQVAASRAALKAELLNGAGAAFDTFKEVQDLLAAQDTEDTAVATALGNRLRFDDVQTLTAPQKAQAGTNMGSAQLADTGNLDSDWVAVFETAIA